MSVGVTSTRTCESDSGTILRELSRSAKVEGTPLSRPTWSGDERGRKRSGRETSASSTAVFSVFLELLTFQNSSDESGPSITRSLKSCLSVGLDRSKSASDAGMASIASSIVTRFRFFPRSFDSAGAVEAWTAPGRRASKFSAEGSARGTKYDHYISKIVNHRKWEWYFRNGLSTTVALRIVPCEVEDNILA